MAIYERGGIECQKKDTAKLLALAFTMLEKLEVSSSFPNHPGINDLGNQCRE
jgi:hypothetical protein